LIPSSRGFAGLLKHLGEENEYYQLFIDLREQLKEQDDIQPFSDAEYVDPIFRDLVKGLTNFDPAKRLTAEEALKHPWFTDVEENPTRGEGNKHAGTDDERWIPGVCLHRKSTQ
jgi:serine/threonine protein kinase